MKRLVAIAAVLVLAAVPSVAADDVDTLMSKAMDELARNGSSGDTSAAQRYLGAILEQRPDHLEARWQLLVLQLAPSRNVDLNDRAETLAAFSYNFNQVAKLAKAARKEAFLHYMNAKHASFYEDYERGLAEIDRALALEPRSARYLKAKGSLLAESGQVNHNDAELERGIAILKQAQELSRMNPTIFISDPVMEFDIAMAFASMRQPRWNEVIEHYQRYLETGAQGTVNYAFALNNLSVAYRRAGDCARAKESAEKALAVMKFGAAESNSRYAEFCLEMQKSSAIAQH
jgi:tetratricopeptide (TPR) repeat protein